MIRIPQCSIEAGSLPTRISNIVYWISPFDHSYFRDDEFIGNARRRRRRREYLGTTTGGISEHWKRAPGNYARRLYARLRAPFLPSWYIISRRNIYIYIKNYSSRFNLYRRQNFSLYYPSRFFLFSFWQVIKLQRIHAPVCVEYARKFDVQSTHASFRSLKIIFHVRYTVRIGRWCLVSRMERRRERAPFIKSTTRGRQSCTKKTSYVIRGEESRVPIKADTAGSGMILTRLHV